jgi:Homeodomain-like domain
MHPPQVKQAALDLVAAGHNDCEVSRRLGVPRRTIMDWRRPTYVSLREYALETCPRCWRTAKPMRFTPADYAELLGLYLGDGSISTHARAHRLRIALDAKYPVIIEEARALLARCFPCNRVDVVTTGLKGKCVNVSLYSQHLPCLFPQHGPGPKHRRTIGLEPWQRELVVEAPAAFLRGCIRSDGSVFINRTGPYEYLSYDFTNMSGDIVELFVEACDCVGVVTRVTCGNGQGIWRVRINQRASVALMQARVGLKE